VPFFPGICVEVGAAAALGDGDIAGGEDDASDEDAVVELEDGLELFDW
jgi:hypothetical protein